MKIETASLVLLVYSTLDGDAPIHSKATAKLSFIVNDTGCIFLQ